MRLWCVLLFHFIGHVSEKSEESQYFSALLSLKWGRSVFPRSQQPSLITNKVPLLTQRGTPSDPNNLPLHLILGSLFSGVPNISALMYNWAVHSTTPLPLSSTLSSVPRRTQLIEKGRLKGESREKKEAREGREIETLPTVWDKFWQERGYKVVVELLYKKSVIPLGATANTNLRRNFRSRHEWINIILLPNVVAWAKEIEKGEKHRQSTTLINGM